MEGYTPQVVMTIVQIYKGYTPPHDHDQIIYFGYRLAPR